MIKHGLNTSLKDERVISYQMAEKAIIEYINSGDSPLDFEDIDDILKKVKVEMKVDYISNIEGEKKSFVDKTPSTK